VNVASITPAAGNANTPGITIVGASDADVINLGAGADIVTLGSAAESVNGGAGAATVNAVAATATALLHGGPGTLALDIAGGGTASLNSADTGVTDVNLAASSQAWVFTANAQAGLYIDDQSSTADTLTAGGAHQVIAGGAAGKLTVIDSAAGVDTFRDASTLMNGDTVENFASGYNTLNLTDLSAAHASATFTENAQGTAGQLTVTDGTHTAAITLFGQFMAAGFSGTAAAAGFSLSADSLSGTDVRYQPVVAPGH
jgi:hypothetical protein